MFRKELRDLLLAKPMTISEIARQTGARPKEIEEDLLHLEKSLKHEGRRLVVTPAVCLKCGFEFERRKLHRPGKCPKCRGTWIDEPCVRVG